VLNDVRFRGKADMGGRAENDAFDPSRHFRADHLLWCKTVSSDVVGYRPRARGRIMRRREFITRIVGVAAAWPLAARAQQEAIPRVGYVFVGARNGTDVSNAGLRQGLTDPGYDIGRNLILEERYANGK